MFQVLLFDQWKAVRMPLAMTCIIAFGIPVLSVQDAGPIMAQGLNSGHLLADQALWGTAYPLLAAGIGLLLGVTAWAHDHRTDHVYALSLPIHRWKYSMLKFGVGAVLLVPVILTLCAGTIGAAFVASIPEGLTAYPLALTVRFGLTSLMAFAVFFAISSGTPRTAGVVLGSLAIVVGSAIFLDLTGISNALLDNLVQLFGTPGSPFEAFGGRWMLIDV